MSKYENRERSEYSEHRKKSSRKENHQSEYKETDSHKSRKHSREKEDRYERRSHDRETKKRHSKDHHEHSSKSGRRHKQESPDRKESKRRRNKSPISPRGNDKKESSYGLQLPIKQEKDFDKRRSELTENRKHGRIKSEFDVSRVKSEHGQDIKQERFSEQRRKERNERLEEAFKGPSSSGGGQADEPIEKEKTNLGLSGALTEDTNTYKGVVIKYNEPPEARIPKKRWRLYPFKDNEALKVLHLHRQSAYLIGRLRRIVDIAIDHPSCSKQHAVLQFRCVEEETDGRLRRLVRPYIIDLGAANGTFLNNQQIESQRYYEMKEQDVLKFGFSSREYVLLHDKSDTTEQAEQEDDSE